MYFSSNYVARDFLSWSLLYKFQYKKFLDAGIQDVSTSISIVHDLIERSPDGDDGDESDKHIEARDRFYLFSFFKSV